MSPKRVVVVTVTMTLDDDDQVVADVESDEPLGTQTVKTALEEFWLRDAQDFGHENAAKWIGKLL